MNSAFATGFIKRAVELGLSTKEAEELVGQVSDPFEGLRDFHTATVKQDLTAPRVQAVHSALKTQLANETDPNAALKAYNEGVANMAKQHPELAHRINLYKQPEVLPNLPEKAPVEGFLKVQPALR